MKTQWLLRECFSVVLDGDINLKQLSQLVSTIPVSVVISYLNMFGVSTLHIKVRCDMKFITIYMLTQQNDSRCKGDIAYNYTSLNTVASTFRMVYRDGGGLQHHDVRGILYNIRN